MSHLTLACRLSGLAEAHHECAGQTYLGSIFGEPTACTCHCHKDAPATPKVKAKAPKPEAKPRGPEPEHCPHCGRFMSGSYPVWQCLIHGTITA